jgi:amino acid transporter
MMMSGVWSMCSAFYYGEVRGAESLNKSYWSMQAANWLTAFLNIVLLAAIFSLLGLSFFQSSGVLFWNGESIQPIFPSVPLWTYFATGSAALAVLTIVSAAFYTATMAGLGTIAFVARPVFAMSMDRMLPSWMAELKKGAPVYTYIAWCLCAVPTVIAYCYYPAFTVIFLDANLVYVLCFAGTSVAGALLPLTRPNLFKGSASSKYYIGKVPLMTIVGSISAAFLLYTVLRYATDSSYGVNNLVSAEYLGLCYALIALMYFYFQWRRKKEGIDVRNIYREIPVE